MKAHTGAEGGEKRTDPLYELKSMLLGQNSCASDASVHLHRIKDVAIGAMMPLCGHRLPLQQAAKHQHQSAEHGALKRRKM